VLARKRLQAVVVAGDFGASHFRLELVISPFDRF
jgi:hypothetical protein